MIEKIGSYFEIVCALINCCRLVFVKDTSIDKIKQYIEEFKDKNEKQPKWTDLNATNSVDNFPKMTFDEL